VLAAHGQQGAEEGLQQGMPPAAPPQPAAAQAGHSAARSSVPAAALAAKIEQQALAEAQELLSSDLPASQDLQRALCLLASVGVGGPTLQVRVR